MDWFVPLTGPAGSGGRRIFALPQAGGGCATFAGLAELLEPDRPVLALNLPGRQARFLEPPCTELGPLLDDLTADLAGQDDVTLFGYCSGALLAFELARRLTAGGRPPAALVVVAYPAPDRARPPRTLHRLSGPEFWSEILSYGGVPADVAAQPDFRDIFEVALRADYELTAGYEYATGPALTTPITVLYGSWDTAVGAEEAAGWRRHTTGRFRAVAVPGGHWLLTEAPGALAGALRAV